MKMNEKELISLIKDIIKGDIKLSSDHYIKCKRFDMKLSDVLAIYNMSKMDVDSFIKNILYTENNYFLYKDTRFFRFKRKFRIFVRRITDRIR